MEGRSKIWAQACFQLILIIYLCLVLSKIEECTGTSGGGVRLCLNRTNNSKALIRCSRTNENCRPVPIVLNETHSKAVEDILETETDNVRKTHERLFRALTNYVDGLALAVDQDSVAVVRPKVIKVVARVLDAMLGSTVVWP
ncbi:hypothetical protein BaRGS_00040049 [Batillaria attramentaria]|uniref:Uncharacterized protein n=1 Tax=Batillaria attramentaria TaxID=370345 RepID=A0ABD0J1D3_9CAEN